MCAESDDSHDSEDDDTNGHGNPTEPALLLVDARMIRVRSGGGRDSTEFRVGRVVEAPELQGAQNALNHPSRAESRSAHKYAESPKMI